MLAFRWEKSWTVGQCSWIVDKVCINFCEYSTGGWDNWICFGKVYICDWHKESWVDINISKVDQQDLPKVRAQ